jgi:hypothetical protein
VGIGLAFRPRLGWTSRRLALFRKLLGAFILVTGAPVVALYRAESSAIRHVLLVLAVLSLSMVLPMVRLLCFEWRHNHRFEAARAASR